MSRRVSDEPAASLSHDKKKHAECVHISTQCKNRGMMVGFYQRHSSSNHHSNNIDLSHSRVMNAESSKTEILGSHGLGDDTAVADTDSPSSLLQHSHQSSPPASPDFPNLITIPQDCSPLSRTIPSEIVGLIESYLPASAICALSATSVCFYKRWTTKRWRMTFQLHYGLNHGYGTSTGATEHRPKSEDYYYGSKYGTWENSFIGCCCDNGEYTSINNNSSSNNNHYPPLYQCSINGGGGESTQLNVSALIPSVRRAYANLWDTIELAMLGYYDTHITTLYQAQQAALTITTDNDGYGRRQAFLQETGEVRPMQNDELLQMSSEDGGNSVRYRRRQPSQRQRSVRILMRALRNAVLPDLMEYVYFVIWRGGSTTTTTTTINDNNCFRLTTDPTTAGYSLIKLFATFRHGRSLAKRLLFGRFRNTFVMSNVASSKKRMSTSKASLALLSRSSAVTSMSAWKLACILKERGVDCLRCRICDRIDVLDDGRRRSNNNSVLREGVLAPFGWIRDFRNANGGGEAWMTPCRCPELVHRRCLEKSLGLTPKCFALERCKFAIGNICQIWNNNKRRRQILMEEEEESLAEDEILVPSRNALAPRVWISYDGSFATPSDFANDETTTNTETTTPAAAVRRTPTNPIRVDAQNCFLSPRARCRVCQVRYRRSVRLPRSKAEVVISSLADPLSLLRALSTMIHFVLCVVFIAATEGTTCTPDSCADHVTVMNGVPFVLKWPGNFWKGLALAWWQLQQCLMLHIFFSPRFAAIVDRLWMGPISFFYCRLYFYFLVTSAVLAVSFIPFVTRSLHHTVLWMVPSEECMEALSPIWNVVAYLNLAQYAVVSTTVVCIFWRTNYRIFTVADGREHPQNCHQSDGAFEPHRDDIRFQELRRGGVDGGRARIQNNERAANNNNSMAGGLPPTRVGPLAHVAMGGEEGAWNLHPIYHGQWQ